MRPKAAPSLNRAAVDALFSVAPAGTEGILILLVISLKYAIRGGIEVGEFYITTIRGIPELDPVSASGAKVPGGLKVLYVDITSAYLLKLDGDDVLGISVELELLVSNGIGGCDLGPYSRHLQCGTMRHTEEYRHENTQRTN